MIPLHRAPDRHRWRQYFGHGWRRCAGAPERAVYGCNQARELIDSDAVFLDVTPYNTSDQARINFLGYAYLAHIPTQALAFTAYG